MGSKGWEGLTLFAAVLIVVGLVLWKKREVAAAVEWPVVKAPTGSIGDLEMMV